MSPVYDAPVPRMDGRCTHTAKSGEQCPEPMAYHLITDRLASDGAKWTLGACEEHFTIAYQYCLDWHTTGPCCDVPGTVWIAAEHQGEGTCVFEVGLEVAELLTERLDAAEPSLV